VAAGPALQALGGPFDLRGHRGALLIANQLALAVTTLSVVVAAGSLVGRFRHARGLERLQLRWVALTAVLVVPANVVVLVALVIEVPGATVLLNAAVGICLVVLPMATGAAILRYRLYDLDRIISRTLAYGLLTLLLAGGYAVVALVLGQNSSLVVAGATLAVAAVFQPARRRIQEVVDRRLNRRRHDAAQTIAAFSARLRDQVDLATLTAEVLAVVSGRRSAGSATPAIHRSPPALPADGFGRPAAGDKRACAFAETSGLSVAGPARPLVFTSTLDARRTLGKRFVLNPLVLTGRAVWIALRLAKIH
jgi:hypothetical protein